MTAPGIAAPFLRESIEGQTAFLTLNRPPANSLNLAFFEQLRRRLAEIEKNPGIRAVILSSALPKYFSSGIDLDEYSSLAPKDRSRLFLELIELHRQLCRYTKPTIAAINGYALLGGWIIAMGCDFRFIAQETGKISLSEVRLGLTPSSILIATLARMSAKQSLVKEMILTGRAVRAPEAFEGGLVDRLVPGVSLAQKALDFAQNLAQLPLNAYALTKLCYRESLCGDLDEIFQKSTKEFISALNHWEAQEGLDAAWKKRRPKYVREETTSGVAK
ncbi:MAG: enoyl-CoA hydratase/isomerase family protein [Elusimicrobia bacterium]|nr:enoyl-CoA hydratase/isomerase family protein [Elusimicrobiota bacterium]